MRDMKQTWWRQMGAMSQGLLFLDGNLAHPDEDRDAVARQQRRIAVRAQRYARARCVLNQRRLRTMTALSLFR